MRAFERMTNLLHSATLGGFLACACTTISLPCLGQEHRPPVPVVDSARPMAWTGRWIEETPAEDHPSRDLVERIAREQKQWWEETQTRVKAEGTGVYAGILSRRLAELRLQRQTGEVAGEEFDRRVFALIAAGSWVEAYPGRWEFLREVRLEMGKLAVDLGFYDAALFVTSRLLFSGEWSAPPYEMVPASDALLAEEAEALKDPGLEAFRSSVMQASAPAPAAVAPAQDSDLERKVRDALSMSQWGLVEELGSYAAEALAAIVAESPDELPARERDALYWLFKVGELRGAQLVLDLWDRGGIYFKKRVLRAMREADVLSNPGTWSFVRMPKGLMEVATEAPRMAEPLWIEVLGRLASDPDVARDSLERVGYVAHLDGLDRTLQEALIAGLDAPDADLVNDVLKALEHTQGRASAVPVLEHALDHPLAQVRAFAAERLTLYPRNDALRARAGHPDPTVRRAAAVSLVGQVGQAVYREDGVGLWITDDDRFQVDRSVDERDVECLSTLLQDPDAAIREVAAEALRRNPDLPVPDELVVGLTRDASPAVRRQMARWRSGRPADPGLLEMLAADSEREVLDALDRRLDDLARTTLDGEKLGPRTSVAPDRELLWNDSYLDALLARIANPTLEFGAKYALLAAGREAAGATAVVRQAIVTRNRDALGYLVWALETSANNRPRLDAGWQGLAGEDLRALVRAVWGLPQELQIHEPLVDVLRSEWPEVKLRPLRAILLDQTSPADLRLVAAMLTAATPDQEWRSNTLHALGQLGGTKAPLEPINTQDVLGRIPGRLVSPAARSALLLDLVRAEGVPPWAVLHLSRETVRAGVTVSPGLSLEILERLGEREQQTLWPLLDPALAAISWTEEQPRLELVRRLATHPVTAPATIEKLGQTHLQAHLPVLEGALLGSPIQDWVSRLKVQVSSTQALSAYLDDQAAEILLKGLGATTDTAVRDACFAALETIRRYQDEKERWAQRKGSEAARDAAITELVPMLADADANVRAQAARSLGALGAVEQLPALVRLLKDPAPEVRAAAQEAIDVLTRPAPQDGKD